MLTLTHAAVAQELSRIIPRSHRKLLRGAQLRPILIMITLEEADDELAFVDADFATCLVDWEHEPIDGEAMDGTGELNAELQ